MIEDSEPVPSPRQPEPESQPPPYLIWFADLVIHRASHRNPERVEELREAGTLMPEAMKVAEQVVATYQTLLASGTCSEDEAQAQALEQHPL